MAVYVTVTAAGASLTLGAATASTPIPNTSSGTPPKYVRVAVTSAGFVRVGQAAVVATATDTLIQPNDSLVMRSHGCTHIAGLQQGVGGTMQISPLEDQ